MPSKIVMPFGLGARYKDDPHDYPYARAGLVCDAGRPTKIDNRHLFPVVWNQGKEGACTGMALAAGLSVLYGVELSPRFALWAAKQFDEWPGENYDGASLRGACKGAQDLGCCRHNLWPFAPYQTGGKDPGADADAALHKLAGYERLASQDEMLHGVWTSDFFLATVEVDTGWIRPTALGRIRSDPRYVKRGLHAVVICGYDETAGYWLLRNSWRYDWADFGYAWLSFDAEFLDAWVLLAGA